MPSAVQQAEARTVRLATAAEGQEQRQTLRRLYAFLQTQEQRLIAADTTSPTRHATPAARP